MWMAEEVNCLDFGEDYACYASACRRQIEDSCEDNDEGPEEFWTKGSISGYSLGKLYYKEDSCYVGDNGESRLNEVGCRQSLGGGMEEDWSGINCENHGAVCIDGRCVLE